MKTDRRTTLTALLGLAATHNALAAPFDGRRATNPDVVLDRGFCRVGYGQLHFRYARPADQTKYSGARPILCFHQTPNSSQVFVEFMQALATDRDVFAVDTPGLGESDLPTEPPEIADYAQAMAEFLGTMQLTEVDVVGYHTGASIALELAHVQPNRIAHLMLVGLALFTEKERQSFFDNPWPRPREAGGQHLLSEWERSFHWRGKDQSDASVERTFVQKIAAGDTAWWGARAVMRHDLAGRLEQTSKPLLIVNAADDLFEVTPRAKSVAPQALFKEYDAHGFGIFEVLPYELATLATGFFDREAPRT